MRLLALADLHLALSCPGKDMAIFGPSWEGYMERIAVLWRDKVRPEDWVLLPGDISWAMRPAQAAIDLAWIHDLPGHKVLIQGNHDYWWPGTKVKLRELLPESIRSAQGELVEITESVAVTGTRLWENREYSFSSIIQWRGSALVKERKEHGCDDEALFERELVRLEKALKLFKPQHTTRIVMVHYPPIGLDLAPSRVSALLEKAHVDHCIFGHLHSLEPRSAPFGKARGVHYHFVAADYLAFEPLTFASIPSSQA